MKEDDDKLASMRPRKLDLDRPLTILGAKDLESISSLRKKLIESKFERVSGTADILTKEEFQQLLEWEPPKRQPGVPTPPVSVVKELSNAHRRLSTFKRPKNYINYLERQRYPSEIAHEYDMDEADEKWLKTYNSRMKLGFIKDITFERICALVNREVSGKQGHCSVYGVMELSRKFKMDVALMESDVEAIKSYLMEKNKVKMEKYESAQKKTENLRNHLQRMKLLRQDFEKIRVILDIVGKRERVKKKLLRLQVTEEMRKAREKMKSIADKVSASRRFVSNNKGSKNKIPSSKISVSEKKNGKKVVVVDIRQLRNGTKSPSNKITKKPFMLVHSNKSTAAIRKTRNL